MPKKVVILGGGVAGMSAAHELVERGFDVVVYEKKPTYLGGKARSVDVTGSDLPKPDGSGNFATLPGEHGFRFFPGFYQHITDTMKRIPFTDATGRDNPNGVFDNLVEVERVGIMRYDHPALVTVVSFPKSLADLRAALAILKTPDTGLTDDDLHFFAGKVWQLMTSCRRRRELDYEKIGWWQYMDADDRSDAYRSLLVEGLTRTLVAANAKLASTKTGGDIFIQLLLNIATPGMRTDRVLNGPTTDVWLKPWEEYLTGKGVTFYRGALIEKLEVTGGQVQSVQIRDWQKKQAAIDAGATNLPDDSFPYDPPAVGDYYLLATPIEVTATVFTEDVKKNTGALSRLDELAKDVAWMNGIQFYLNQEIDTVRGHCIYVNSEWALTSISQLPFWKGYTIADHGDGQVKTIFSVDISDWDTPSNPKNKALPSVKAKDCQTFDEISAQVWDQLKHSLKDANGQNILTDDMLHVAYVNQGQSYQGYYLDHSIDLHVPPPAVDSGASTVGEAVADKKFMFNHEPLLINTADSWGHRPDAYVEGISNLFLASDYVRTNTDLATMEGANEAARRAVNCIIDLSGSNATPCTIWDLHEPNFFKPWKWYDSYRYKRGLPYHQPPGWFRALMMVWGLIYGIGLAIDVAFYWLENKFSTLQPTPVANRPVSAAGTAPPHPKTTRNSPQPRRVPVMLGLMTLGVALLVFDSYVKLGWHTAAIWGYGLTALYALYVVLSRDRVVGALLAFALVAGFAELVSDYYLVAVTRTLVYPAAEPLLWTSPAYMPSSWAVVLTQVGFIGYLLMQRLNPWLSGLLLVPLSGLLIPLYENWAIRSGWWDYVGAPEWHGVPYYIYLAEALLVLPVPYLTRRAIDGGGRWVLIGGVLQGVVMLVACLVAFKLVG